MLKAYGNPQSCSTWRKPEQPSLKEQQCFPGGSALLSRFRRVRLCATPLCAIPGLLQAGTLEWVATAFSSA